MSDPEVVEIDQATERWSEVWLADGTHLRVKLSVFSVYRLPGQFDAAGNQVYNINWVPVVAEVRPPPGSKP